MKKSLQTYIASGVVALTALSPMVTLAQVTASSTVDAQAQALFAQIQTLKQQLAGLLQANHPTSTQPRRDDRPWVASSTIGTTTRPGCGVFERSLRVGMRGEDVKNLQRIIAAHDPQFATSSITGMFGPLTQRAVVRFQETFRIASSSTGFVGTLTREFLKRECELRDEDKKDHGLHLGWWLGERRGDDNRPGHPLVGSTTSTQ